MTKAEIMKLAEFERGAFGPVGGNADYVVRKVMARLLPLIEALAESNEKLVEALTMYHTIAVHDCLPYSKQIKLGEQTLAEHKERMEKFK